MVDVRAVALQREFVEQQQIQAAKRKDPKDSAKGKKKRKYKLIKKRL